MLYQQVSHVLVQMHQFQVQAQNFFLMYAYSNIKYVYGKYKLT